MNDNTPNTDWFAAVPFDPIEARRTARGAAARESVAHGLRLLDERLAQIADVAEPLDDVPILSKRDPELPISLGEEHRQRIACVVAAIHALHEYHRFHQQLVQEAATAAPGWDAINEPLVAWQRRHAHRSWSEGDRVLALDAPELRQRYEQAIAFGLGALQAFDTLAGLQAHYYDDRHRYGSQFPECPEAGTVKAWAQAARLAVSGGDELLPQAIAEAAFWRRACQIDPALPSRDPWADEEGGMAAA